MLKITKEDDACAFRGRGIRAARSCDSSGQSSSTSDSEAENLRGGSSLAGRKHSVAVGSHIQIHLVKTELRAPQT